MNLAATTDGCSSCIRGSADDNDLDFEAERISLTGEVETVGSKKNA